MKYKKVALIMGGMGAEREVSLQTGKGFASALRELKLPFVEIDAKEDFPQQLQASKVDVALLALHGKFGEDGTVQGICEYFKIPYTTSGVLASALCMDKYFSKQIFIHNKIPTPHFELCDVRKQKLDSYQTKIPFPLVVKPSREGSSVGVSICQNTKAFVPALELAAKYDYEVIIEEFIDGMELTIPIVAGRVLTPIEIVPKTDFYDYKRKYTAGQTDYILPARLPEAILQQCRDLTLKAWEACRVKVYARMDFRISKDMKPYLLEINTQPGCTPTSLLPKSAAHDGISFPQLIEILIENASLDYAGVR